MLEGCSVRTGGEALTRRLPDLPNAAEFPALAGFLRGYLQEGFEAEHGSPAAALGAFLGAARPGQVRRLAREAAHLLDEVRGLPLARLSHLLTRGFRCGWRPHRVAEVHHLLARAAAASPAPAAGADGRRPK
jgi:hypothetical protein